MSVTPNAMPVRISDAIVPNVDLTKYRDNNLPLSVGSRLGMDKHLVRWALDGQPHNGFWLIATEDNARVRVTL